MNGNHHVLGDILRASPEARSCIIGACIHIEFQGDDKIILDTIKSLSTDFDYADLYHALPVKERNDLIGKCMEQDNHVAAKEYISRLRARKDTEHLGIFKRFLKEK